MAKGFYSQGVCLLTDGQTTLKDIKRALQKEEFEIGKEVSAGDNWCFGGPTIVVPYLPEVNGYVAIDLVNQHWPDSMGDPKDSMVFAAWSMGQFGPLTYPGGLERAGQHSWTWEQGRTIAQQHRGFIRIRLSYIFGGREDTPVLPEGYDPLAEMNFLSRLVLALFPAPGVLCYFNPNGEVLSDRAGFREVWSECKHQRKIPLSLWMNVRFYNLSEQFGFMDTVGNGQLDVADVEAAFPHGQYDPGDVDYYLRNVTHYLLESGRDIQTGEPIDGPGESNLSWTTELVDDGALQPPRRTLRLFPSKSRKALQKHLASLRPQ